MIHETIELNIDYGKVPMEHSEYRATLVSYLHDDSFSHRTGKLRKTLLLCPGGGYRDLCPREGESVAIRFMGMGYHCFVLNYSRTPDRYPAQLLEAAAAIRYIREHAEQWHIDTGHITIGGFSAGGHVAGSLGCMYRDEVITRVLGGTAEDYRPLSMLLCYPVITAFEFAHRASFKNLLGAEHPELYKTVSLEKRVNEDTVPAFIWHTFEDAGVPVENSLLMASALRQYRIPCALHIFNHGPHGIALAADETNIEKGGYDIPECAVWPDLFDQWNNAQ